jgi:hypothetical protein
MPLPGTVQPIPNGAHGFDANAVLTARNCAAAKAMGFAFAIRYVGRGAADGAGNLSTAEAQVILAAGLGLMAVQHVAQAGWKPTAALGQTNGQHAALHASAIGFPGGVNLWVDLEGIDHGTGAEDVIGYCNAWCAEAVQAGFVPGVYVGANAILSGDQLYWRLQLKHYWKSGSTVPAIPLRGYQLVQRIVSGDRPFGVGIDRNVAITDGFGDAALMLA